MPASIIPSLRYRNAPAAIEWLCRVFGVQKNLVVPDESGGIAHAQLSCGDGMMMLGSVRDDEWRRFIRQPDEISGAATQSIYLVVPDADVTYERAKNAGAEILIPVKDEEYGGRSFSCRDLEGHLWTIGTYDPWESAED
ncbi:MAG TPA: VOC family protein [Chthoniobacterales bacterium]|jgi:uncharacterized glyoxalase superfamily protein PhnB|nr:VOC family protein [Chthoniobacterales bacterium]